MKFKNRNLKNKIKKKNEIGITNFDKRNGKNEIKRKKNCKNVIPKKKTRKMKFVNRNSKEKFGIGKF